MVSRQRIAFLSAIASISIALTVLDHTARAVDPDCNFDCLANKMCGSSSKDLSDAICAANGALSDTDCSYCDGNAAGMDCLKGSHKCYRDGTSTACGKNIPAECDHGILHKKCVATGDPANGNCSVTQCTHQG